MRQKGAIIDMKNFVFIASIAFFFRWVFSLNKAKMWNLWMKNCTDAKQTLLFKKLKSNFFVSGPIDGATISHIFSFNKKDHKHSTCPKYSKQILPPNLGWLMNCCCLIQLIQNIQNISFHQPFKILVDSWTFVASIQLVTTKINLVLGSPTP